MSKKAGLWIDHRQAVIVLLNGGVETIRHVISDMEKHVRFSGGSRAEQGGGEDQQDRQFADHLKKYYDEVITQLGDSEAILVFGPGEAKGELEKRLAHKGLGGRVIGVETVDKMTDPQIAAKVRHYFLK